MTRPAPFSQRILVGPLTPTVAGGGKTRTSAINQPRCLGDYLHHPQIRTFYLHPDLLFDAVMHAEPSLRAQLPPDAVCFGAAPDDSIAALLARLGDWRPDVLIWWGLQSPLPEDIAAAPCATVLVVSDWQFHFSLVEAYARAFDRVCCDRKLLGLLESLGLAHAYYWPAYSFDPELIFETPALRDIDVGFWGNLEPATYQARNQYLLRLARMAPELRIEISSRVPTQAFARLLSRSRLAFNHALRGEMNLRAYEAPACGALLMCEEDNLEVRDILGDACLYYHAGNFEARIRAQLADAADLRARAKVGQERIRKHSYTAQFGQLLRLLPERPSLLRQPLSASPHAFTRRVLKLQLSNLPVLQTRALGLLEAAGAAAPGSPLLGTLAVLRQAHVHLLAHQLPLPQPQSDPVALMRALTPADDPVSLHNLGWMALQQQDWPRLAHALAALGQALSAELPIDTVTPWLPVRLTRLLLLREQVLAETAGPGQEQARQAGLRHLLRWSRAFLAGYLARVQERPEDALEAFAAACGEEPDLAEAWFELAHCLNGLQRLPEAISALEAGLEQGLTYPHLWLGLIRQLAACGRWGRARQNLATALTIFSGPEHAAQAPAFAQLAAWLEVPLPASWQVALSPGPGTA